MVIYFDDLIWCDYTDFTELCLFTQVANFSHQFKSIQIYIIGNSATFFSIANKFLKKKKKRPLTSIKLVFGDKYFGGRLLPDYLMSFILLLCLLEGPQRAMQGTAELSCWGQCPWMNPRLDLLADT